jgi:hypothetical protein
LSEKLKKNKKSGGAEGDRTADLYNAIVALSQLSYGPNAHNLRGVGAKCKGKDRDVFSFSREKEDASRDNTGGDKKEEKGRETLLEASLFLDYFRFCEVVFAPLDQEKPSFF